MEVETKEFKIQDETYYFRPNFRAMIEFEKIAKKSTSQLDDSSMIDSSQLLYCGVISGMRKKQKEFKLSYDEFIDLIDDNFDELAKVLFGGSEEKKE